MLRMRPDRRWSSTGMGSGSPEWTGPTHMGEGSRLDTCPAVCFHSTMTANDLPPKPSRDSLEREIALVEDLLAAHLQHGHERRDCTVCQALDNRRQQLTQQWLEAGYE